MRNISIRKVMNGFIVDVGCQTLVFETHERLLIELRRYLENSETVEKEYTERYGMQGGGLPGPTEAYATPTVPPGYGAGAVTAGGALLRHTAEQQLQWNR